MLLVIDVGNTNIVLGVYDKKNLVGHWRISTDRVRTTDEYGMLMMNLFFHDRKVNAKDIKAIIISSVVPQITNAVKLAAEKVLKKEPMVLGPGVKTGLNILMDNPGQLGADLVANAVAGIHEYSLPLAIIDMGTASTVSVVDEKKHYVGGMIFPGMGVSLDALTARASQLSGISIEAPRRIIGKNTIECMKSGVIYSNAAALDGIVDRIEEELGQKITVVATGGLARKIIPHCKREILLDEDLLLKGLLIIYEKNRKEL